MDETGVKGEEVKEEVIGKMEVGEEVRDDR